MSTNDERPGFYFHEKTLWFSAGEAVLVLPPDGWLQPGGSHADSPEPKRRLRSLMEVSGLAAHFDIVAAPAAAEDDLRLVHSAGYLSRFKALSDAAGGAVHPTAPFAAGSYEIAALSAGQAMAAVFDVATGRRRRAYAVSRPSGHHCLPDMPMGFCHFANVAIAVRRAQRAGLAKVVVLDWDVHHGNGTQACFYDDGSVLTLSLHQEGCFPPGASGAMGETGRGAGVGANVNIPLWPGSGHEVYLHAFDHIAVPAIRAFAPDMIVVVNGLDANGVDPLARMLAHSETFRAMTRGIGLLADELCGGRLAIIQEGGYAESAVPFCGHAVLEELAGVSTAVEDPFLELMREQQPSTAFNAAHVAHLQQHPRYRPVGPAGSSSHGLEAVAAKPNAAAQTMLAPA
ncbi:acetoin utilization deacetylase AcuC-like enzyme [Phyllobacterium myrsinacearum]|uniref:class II histone deacetylase n=1 Tax=Phyllobacterium myrsinacearum TaxID=28101 RepID=UPI00102A79E7|nr:class II histone deacetylase [Phyllobacterium myrsinacearum]RZS76834.1 acetoin utilization deacetylase AcuC-like enzyme [Phyllobacterium myrsinacearum]